MITLAGVLGVVLLAIGIRLRDRGLGKVLTVIGALLVAAVLALWVLYFLLL